MNRKEKGWLAEAAVKRYYEGKGAVVFNLAPMEPAADLLVLWSPPTVGTIIVEVKYGRGPGELDLKEKQQIDARRAWCDTRGLIYRLWTVHPTLGKGGAPTALQGTRWVVRGLETSKSRKGLSLRVYEKGQFPLLSPLSPPLEREKGLQALSPSRADSGAVKDAGTEKASGERRSPTSPVSPSAVAAPPAKPSLVTHEREGYITVSHLSDEPHCSICKPAKEEE